MAKDDAEGKSKNGLMKIVMIVAGVLVLVGGAFAFVTLGVPDKASDAEDSQETVAPEETWKDGEHRLETLFVNLAGTNGKRYLKVGLTFSYRAESPSAQTVRFTELDTRIRDRLTILLSGKSIEDIDGGEKKKLLKKELEEVLQELLFEDAEEPGRIEAVFYYEFLIQ